MESLLFSVPRTTCNVKMLIGESLAVVLCITYVFWSIAYYRSYQQALIWWNDRLWMRMHREGEGIRNGLLQDSFVMRRHLELSSANLVESQQDKYYLTTIEKFHHSLKELSDYLSPAHVDDNLPVTIKHILESWKSRFPALNVDISVPNDWNRESHHLSNAVLMVLDELLQLSLSDISSIPSIYIYLNSHPSCNECTITTVYLDVLNKVYPQNMRELTYLRRAFKFLTSGKCVYNRKNNTETWYFKWQCS